MSTSVKEALQKWEAKQGQAAGEAREVGLQFQYPPVERMTADLGVLVNCEKLSLSTNCIDRIVLVPTMKHLRILALGRNNIKSFAGLEPVADTLEELWISYNLIDKVKGIEVLSKLKVLFMAHNLIRDWSECSKLNALRGSLEDLIFLGNPLAEAMDESAYRAQTLKALPFLKRLDGEPNINLEQEI